MPKSRVFQKGGGGAVDFNMTPMIDVTFQLIIFFILAGQIVSKELAKMDLPSPWRSVADDSQPLGVSSRVIVNIVSAVDVGDATKSVAMAGEAKEWRVGARTIEKTNSRDDRKVLKELLADRYNRWVQEGRKGSDFSVEIRADKRVRFSEVKPVMLAAAAAGIVKMNLTALVFGAQ